MAADDDTIRAAAAGEAAAFERLLSPLLEPAFKLAMLILGDHAEAEDAVQEAAVRAWARIRQLRGDRNQFRAWFLSIVANQCRSMRRRSWWKVIKVSEVLHTDRWAEDTAARDMDVRRAIERLDPSERFALFAFFYLDLPLEDAARVMDVPLSTAKSRIYRAVRRLRKDATLEEVLQA